MNLCLWKNTAFKTASFTMALALFLVACDKKDSGKKDENTQSGEQKKDPSKVGNATPADPIPDQPVTLPNAMDIASIEAMAGCFQVDYNYSEIEALGDYDYEEKDPNGPDYLIDPRNYDASETNSSRELIAIVESTPTKIHFQHILFIVQPDGKILPMGKNVNYMKHHGETWVFEADSYHRFDSKDHWVRQTVAEPKGTWRRHVTSLDDGPRHQSVAKWIHHGEQSEWIGEGLAPIPGREKRDMGRRDYNQMYRKSRLLIDPWGWMERQYNTKIDATASESRELANEKGKNFYMKIDDKYCAGAKEFLNERKGIWELSREVWAEVYERHDDLKVAGSVNNEMPRFFKLWNIDTKYGADYNAGKVSAETVKDEIRKVIEDHLN